MEEICRGHKVEDTESGNTSYQEDEKEVTNFRRQSQLQQTTKFDRICIVSVDGVGIKSLTWHQSLI